MKKLMRRCKHCHCLFEVCNKVKKHEYCKKKKCQRAKKNKWQRDKIKNDENYRKDQKDANEVWLNKTPDYWKNYHHKNQNYSDRNRKKQHIRNKSRRKKPVNQTIAKMDALSPENNIISGKYKLVPVSSDLIAKMDTLIVEINDISSDYTHSGT